MVFSILVNTSDYINNSTFEYKFRSVLRCPQDAYAISCSNISFYNNSFNITTTNQNNTLTLNWLGTIYTIIIPNGYYSALDINAYIQGFCYNNGLYLITSTGNIVYFIEILTNSPRYAIQLNLYPIPTSTQATTLLYTIPSGVSWSLPGTATTPLLSFNNSFGSLIGLVGSTYPATTQITTQSFISTFTPVISTVSSYIFTISLINNPFSNGLNNIFAEVPLSNSLGNLVSYEPSNFVFNEIYNGSYQSFQIQVFDQNMNLLQINESEFVIHLVFISENEFKNQSINTK
jgi:hypothetical protein